MQYISESVGEAFRTAFADYLAIAQDFYIHGAEVTTAPSGANTLYSVTAGHVFYRGEPMPMDAHSVVRGASQVIYIEVRDDAVDIAPVINLDGTTDYVMRRRHARMRVASAYPAEYMAIDAPRKRDLDLLRLKGRIVPTGGIVPYMGSMEYFSNNGLGLVNTPMEGWAICNGLNGTVDLRGMVPFGATDVPSIGAADPYAGVGGNSVPGTQVGSDYKAIEPNHLPSHVHSLDFPSESYWSAGGGSNASLDSGSGNSAQSIPASTQPQVTDHNDFDVRQASYALVYIQSIL